jgi:hypothetical protein
MIPLNVTSFSTAVADETASASGSSGFDTDSFSSSKVIAAGVSCLLFPHESKNITEI